MSRLRIASAFAAVIAAFCASNVLAGESPASPARHELIVDFNDEVWLRDHNMTEADIKEMVAKLKQNGCQTLITRCGCLGMFAGAPNRPGSSSQTR